MEIWLDVPGYENLYKVSNYGNVVGKERIYFCGNNKSTKRVLRERLIKGDLSRGYKRVTLYGENGRLKRILVHRLVAELFIKNPHKKTEIDHIDGNKNNNRVSNLRWVTHKENLNNPVTLKRKSVAAKGNHMTGRFGALHHNSKTVLCIETKTVYGGIAEAERKTGVKHISMVCCGHRKTAGGFHWRYAN